MPLETSINSLSFQELSKELQASFTLVLREQVSPELAQHFITTLEHCSKWQASQQALQLRQAMQELEKLDAQTQITLKQALQLFILLIKSARLSLTPFLQKDSKESNTHKSFSHELEHLSQVLKTSGLSPLPRKVFPPYPQIKWLSPMGNPVLEYSKKELQRAARIIEILRIRTFSPPYQFERDALTHQLQQEIWLLWQAGPSISHRQSSKQEDVFFAAYQRGLAIKLVKLNDLYAKLVRINPRFANFVPFGLLGFETTIEKLEDLKNLEAHETRFQELSLKLYTEKLEAFREQLCHDQASTSFSSSLTKLYARLSMENPALATKVDRDYQGHLFQQALTLILHKLENTASRLKHLQTSNRKDLPSEQHSYQSSALFVLDLKHFHRGLLETTGGVHSAGAFREILMMAGSCGFSLPFIEISLKAEDLSIALSELAMRSGLLEAPLDSLEEKHRQIQLEELFKQPQALSTTANAHNLLPETTCVLKTLESIQYKLEQKHFQTEPLLIIKNTERATDFITALCLLRLVDYSSKSKTKAHQSLLENLAIVPRLSAGLAEEKCTSLLQELHSNQLYRDYLTARGEYQELRLGNAPKRKHLQSAPFTHALQDYQTRKTLYNKAQELGIKLTLALASNNLEEAPNTILAQEPESLNHHLTIELDGSKNLRSEGSALQKLDFFDTYSLLPKLERGLTALTTQTYLPQKLDPQKLRAFEEFGAELARHAQIVWAKLWERAEPIIPQEKKLLNFLSRIRDWYSLSQGLQSWLHASNKQQEDENKAATQAKAQNYSSQLLALQNAYREWPLFKHQLRLANQSLLYGHKHLLGLEVSKCLRPGEYTTFYPEVEKTWDQAYQLFQELMETDFESFESFQQNGKADIGLFLLNLL